jgi:hypothetical protein
VCLCVCVDLGLRCHDISWLAVHCPQLCVCVCVCACVCVCVCVCMRTCANLVCEAFLVGHLRTGIHSRLCAGVCVFMFVNMCVCVGVRV